MYDHLDHVDVLCKAAIEVNFVQPNISLNYLNLVKIVCNTDGIT